MSNWCEGSLKLRGKYTDILRFFEEGINAYEYAPSNSDVNYKLIPKEEWCEIEEYDGETLIGNKLKSSGWIYIEDTKRAFVEEDYCSYRIQRDKNDDCILALPFKQAWSIWQQDWIDIAKKYNLEIKIFSIESGMGFWCSTFHVLKDGAIMENDFR